MHYYCRSQTASDAACAIRGHGLGPAAHSLLPAMPAAASADERDLSDAQVETIIYAGEAHARMLPNRFRVDESFDTLALAREDDAEGVSFRQGFFLGDGTGCGKGRQIAGVIADNWPRAAGGRCGYPRTTLLEDARRDWSAIGEEKLRHHAAVA